LSELKFIEQTVADWTIIIITARSAAAHNIWMDKHNNGLLTDVLKRS